MHASDAHLSQPHKNSSYLLRLFFNRFVLSRFWGFRNKGGSKTRKTKCHKYPSWLITNFLFFFALFPPPPSVVLLEVGFSRFWAFRKKIAENVPQPPKKVLTFLRHFLFFFHAPPCARQMALLVLFGLFCG
jgi:hypothetical protein